MNSFLKKIALLNILFFSCLYSGNSQNPNDQQYNFWDNVQFGGGIGLNFGDGFFSGTLAPSAIYRFNPTVATGLGLNATYSSQRNVFNSTVFGASIITLVNPINEIQLSAEFENLFINRNFEDGFFDPNNNDDSYYYPALFMGIGYSTNNVTFGIRYDLLYDENRSIYNSAYLPFIRVFF